MLFSSLKKFIGCRQSWICGVLTGLVLPIRNQEAGVSQMSKALNAAIWTNVEQVGFNVMLKSNDSRFETFLPIWVGQIRQFLCRHVYLPTSQCKSFNIDTASIWLPSLPEEYGTQALQRYRRCACRYIFFDCLDQQSTIYSKDKGILVLGSGT